MAANHADSATLPPRPERTITGLLGDLARESARLLRQEMALVRAELLGKLGQVGMGAAELVAGGLIAYAGFLALLAALILGLAHVMPVWLAALVVGVVVVAIGLGLVLKGRRDVKPENLLPDRTLRTLRQDAQWARGQLR